MRERELWHQVVHKLNSVFLMPVCIQFSYYRLHSCFVGQSLRTVVLVFVASLLPRFPLQKPFQLPRVTRPSKITWLGAPSHNFCLQYRCNDTEKRLSQRSRKFPPSTPSHIHPHTTDEPNPYIKSAVITRSMEAQNNILMVEGTFEGK